MTNAENLSELQASTAPSNFPSAIINPTEEYIFSRGGIAPEEFETWKQRVKADMRADPTKPKDVPAPVLLLRDECILRRQRIVLITGCAGSRKTSALTLLCSAMQGSSLTTEMTAPGSLKGLYFDTEQNPDQTDRVINRVIKATGKTFDTIGLEVYNLLELPRQMIAPMIEELAKESRPDYIIIDNTTDTVETTMDDAVAEQAGYQFRQIAKKYNLCLIGVVHSNEGKGDGTPRGWIGKELLRRADVLLFLTNKGDYSTASFKKFRDGKAPAEFSVYIDDESGLPMLGQPETSTQAKTASNPDKYANIISKIPIMGYSYSELKDDIIRETGKSPQTAERWISAMIKDDVVSLRNGRYYDPAKAVPEPENELPF